MTTQITSGLSASIVKEGKVWDAACATTNFVNHSPTTLQNKFTLASISNLFTASTNTLF